MIARSKKYKNIATIVCNTKTVSCFCLRVEVRVPHLVILRELGSAYSMTNAFTCGSAVAVFPTCDTVPHLHAWLILAVCEQLSTVQYSQLKGTWK